MDWKAFFAGHEGPNVLPSPAKEYRYLPLGRGPQNGFLFLPPFPKECSTTLHFAGLNPPNTRNNRIGTAQSAKIEVVANASQHTGTEHFRSNRTLGAFILIYVLVHVFECSSWSYGYYFGRSDSEFFFFCEFYSPFKKNRISILNYYGANKSEYKTTRLRIKLEGYVGTWGDFTPQKR